jgi:uncharacterized protein (DUF3820 family)
MRPEDLMLLVSRPMPFGKHKGTIIAELLGWEAHGSGSIQARHAPE